MSEDPLLQLTADIVAAHAAGAPSSQDELIALLQSTYAALRSAVVPLPRGPEPAVDPKRSVFPDFIVCLEDGKHLKSLKRHLAASFGMTPDEYRQKWGLPKTYPMVAPNYAAARSALAKGIGLGRKAETKKAVSPSVRRFEEGVSGRASAKRGRPRSLR